MKSQYNTAAAAWLALTNLKVGDKVRVLYKVEQGHFGWDAVWNDKLGYQELIMSEFIGKEATVGKIWNNMIQVTLDDSSFYFPFFVLEVLRNTPEPIYLNDAKDYQATFEISGDIKVGRIPISFATLEDIYTKAKALQ
jgi:hypothetical protein